MKILLIAAASVATLSFATLANAQDVGKVYGSVGVQQTDNDKTNSNLNSISGHIGTKITPHFGVEGDLAYGTNTDKNVDGKYKLTNKAAVYGVGFLPVSPSFDLIGRVGVSDTDLKAPATAGKLEQGTALDYGVGAQYHINSDYALRADYTRSDFNHDKGTADTATLSVVKKF